MKLSCSRAELWSAFQIVSAVVPVRTPREILRNIKLTVADGAATLMGTDQQVGVRRKLREVNTDSAGEVLLPTQRVAAILRELQDSEVQLEVTSEALWIRGQHSEFRLNTEDPVEFPNLPAFADQRYYTIPGRVLTDGITRTIFACDVESSRYALGGILFEVEGNKLTLAATDSKRLAVYRGTVAEGDAGVENVKPVIPAKAMSLISRSVPGDESLAKIAVHQNDVLVECGESVIYSRLVEGRFPPYKQVIPDSFEMTIELVAGPFASAVRQAMIVTDAETQGADFEFGDGLLTIRTKVSDVGTSKIQVPISHEGTPITLTLDPRYVSDFLKVLQPSDPVHLRLNNPDSAAVFDSGSNYTYVVMPLARE
jgi:DNA polymerase-3 subunit beta